MTTATEKLKSLLALSFPETLKQLELWIGLTGWLRHYIPWYQPVIGPLQERKTLLLKNAPQSKGNARVNYTQRTLLEPTEKERLAFEAVQQTFRKGSFLVHFDESRRLYVDLDASQLGVGVFVYHATGDPEVKDLTKNAIQPVLI